MSQANNSITPHNDLTQGLEQISDDLENLTAQLDSLRGAFGYLGDQADDQAKAPLFYMFMNHVRALHLEGEGIVQQAYALLRPYRQPTASDGSEFAARLAEFQEHNTAYALSSGAAREDDSERGVYEQMATARQALLNTPPRTAEQARQLLAVCLAELHQDMTVGGSLPDAILAAMGASIRALAQPDPATNPTPEMARRAWREQGVVILWPEKISDDRQRAALLNIVTKEYGPRAGAPLVVKIERLTKRGKAARPKRGKGARP